MAINPAEVRFYLSNPSASTGYQGVGTAGNSLGKFMSTTQISSTPIDDLFLDLLAPQNAAGQVDYQCFFVYNDTVTNLSMKNPFVWMPLTAYTSGGAAMAVGVDPVGPTPYNSTAVQANVIGSTTTAPPVLTWSGPSMSFNPGGVLTPDIPPGYVVAIWVQRTALDTAALTPQSFTLQVTFDSDN